MNTIPDIAIHATKNELNAVIEALQCFKHHLPTTRQAKTNRTAIYDAYKKLQRKALTEPNKKKLYKLKLKHHEADALENTLSLLLAMEADHFTQTFKDKLHQKLV